MAFILIKCFYDLGQSSRVQRFPTIHKFVLTLTPFRVGHTFPFEPFVHQSCVLT